MNIEFPQPSGLVQFSPKVHRDDRGFFIESWNSKAMVDAGLGVEFVQDNHSYSRCAGTVRGMHCQAPPHAQAKLVRCTRGRILDAVVDVRKGSPSFGDWYAAEISAENAKQLFVPVGFLHGFLTLEDDCEVQYKCSDFYAPGSDISVAWDSCGIDWPAGFSPILSDKDAAAVSMAEFETPFDWTNA